MPHADVFVHDGDQQQEAVPYFFQNMEVSSYVDMLATYRMVYIRSSNSANARNGSWYGRDVTLYCIIHFVATQ